MNAQGRPHPPGPRAPRIVQALRLYRDPVGFLADCERRYGSVFRIRFPGIPPFVYVTEAAGARKLFADRDARAGDARRPFLTPLVGERSLLCLEGEEWTRQRKLLSPPLHGDRVVGWREEIAEIAASEIDSWPRDEPFQARPRMQRITLEVILRIVFALEGERDSKELRELLVRLLEEVDNPLIFGLPRARRFLERPLLLRVPGNPLRRFGRLRDQTDALLLAEIARRRSAAESTASRSDVLSALVCARDEDGEPMTDGEIRDELMTLLTAGHETTATALAWAVERLARHPDALSRLVDEVERGETDYLDAVIKEVLRTRPVVFDTPRALTEPLEVGAYEIPAGWWAAAAIPLVHRTDGLYPEPDSFDPDRFMGDEQPVAGWIPFGGGSRRCLGSRLALLELQTVLSTLLTRRELKPSDAPDERQRMQHVTLAPADGAQIATGPRPLPVEPAPPQG